MELSSKNTKAGIILIIIGVLFLLNNFGIADIGRNIWNLWPLLLIWWGFTKLRNRGKRTEEDINFQVFGDATISSHSPYIRRSSAFGNIRIKVENRDFAGGGMSSIFGKISIDLREVYEVTGYGQLDIHSVFGDIVIRLREDMPYELKGNAVFGSLYVPGGEKSRSVEYRSAGSEEAGDKLVIKISQIFGDIELIH
ncbi:MAG: LiaF-related protein [Candidatus Krumholzibacteriota bacterium]|nr:LiaF-related protein [Candidatus Krumholzibacteriota bacterium]